MFWRRFIGLGAGFGFDGDKELRSHHLRGSLNHSLSHAGDGSAHLKVACVPDAGDAISFREVQIAGSFYESWLALPFDDDPVVLRRAHLFDSNGSGEYALYRTDSGSQS